ncbi:RDD family protein [Cellulomonas endophytica]|uniref:RDD family protein n=1 Tax=Cellulomonas endophytica TaxID=2494735 RepID=UPI0013E9612C|nr:RDD family protein [Cellulomonas endophytica]
MTLVGPAPSAPARARLAGLASRRRRLWAWALDALLLAGVTWWVAGDGVEAPLPTSVALPPFVLPEGRTAPGPWVALGLLLVLQGLTGQTPGKQLLDVAVVDATTRRPVGVVRVLLRQLAHLLDGILLLGYLRAALHRERRTFADSLARTLVVRGGAVVRRDGSPRTPEDERVTAAALVVVLLGIGLALPWATTSRTAAPTPLVCRTTDAAAGVVATATADAATTTSQWRLWVRRTTASTPTTVRWSWPEGALDGRAVGIHTTVHVPSDGLVDETSVSGGHEPPAWPGSPVQRDGAVVELHGTRPVADGWVLASTLKVDDRVVADCRLDARAGRRGA